MASFKSKLFNFIIRYNFVLRGKLHKEKFDFSTSIPAFRERCEKGASRFGKVPPGIIVKVQTIEGIKAEWLVPERALADKLILYMHGGGYVSGSCADHRGLVSKLAKNVGVTVLLFEYRLAPEFPFPAALDDSLTVYGWLISNGYNPRNILFAGESAGGGLCLAALLALKQNKLPYPVAAVAISPWTDLSCSSESYRTKNKLSPAPLDSWHVFSAYYVGSNHATNPLISPLFGDLEGLPPIFINAGVNDELYEDGEKFYLRAKEFGVDVQFRSGPEMIHCYPLLAPMFKEATEAMAEIVKFIRQHLNLKS
jgi:acetyl esterase/lipase